MGNNLSKPSLSTTHVMVPVCKFIVEPHSTCKFDLPFDLHYSGSVLCIHIVYLRSDQSSDDDTHANLF